jgi:hypothetical protein
MEEKQNRRPIIDPFLLILKSRRVLIALASLVVAVLILNVPQLEAISKELLVVVMTLALTLIAGYSVEDAASVARQSTVPVNIHEQIREVLNALLDEAAILAEQEQWRDSGQIESTRPDGSSS